MSDGVNGDHGPDDESRVPAMHTEPTHAHPPTGPEEPLARAALDAAVAGRNTGPTEGPETKGDLDRMARGGLWSVLAHLSTAGAVFLTSVLIGRAVGPAELGRYSFFVWIVRLVPTIVAFGVPTALTRMVSEKEGEGAPHLAAALFRTALRLHLVLVPVPAIATGVLIWKSESDVALGLVIAGGLAVGLLALDYEALLNGLRRFKALSAAAIATAGAQLVTTAFGVVLGFSWEGYVISYVAATTVGLVAYWALARRAASGIDAPPLPVDERKRFFAYARVVAVVVVLDAFVWGRPELWFLERFSTDAQLGFYSAALRLASLPTVLPLVAGRVLMPEFSWLQAAGRKDDVAALFPRICILLMVATAPVAVGGAVLAGPLMSFVYGGEFDDAALATSILFAGSIVNAMAPAVSAAVLTGPRPRFVAEVGGGALVVNLVLAAVLIPDRGAEGAAIATTIVQLGLIPVAAYYVQTRLGLRYPWVAVGKVLAMAFVASALAALAQDALGGVVGLAAAAVVGAVSYGALILAGRVVEISELQRFVRRGGPPADALPDPVEEDRS